MRFWQILFILLITIHPVFGQGETPLYSFFSAGHTYGHPQTPQYGFHPPFKDYFDELNDNPNLEIGFLTGDVVPWKTADYWDSVEVDMAKLGMPLYIAAGNHDIGEEFVMRVYRTTECPSCGKDVKVCLNCRFYSPGSFAERIYLN